MIRTSIALVTRNRPNCLERALTAIARQTKKPFEVVVSDDSDSRYAKECERLVRAFKCRYVRGPQRGLYANRNFVASLCNGTHIRTMDDDHEFSEEHINIIADAIAASPQSIWFLGERGPHDNYKRTGTPSQLGPSGYGYPPTDPDNCWAIADGCTVYPIGVFKKAKMVEFWPFGQSYLEFGARLHFCFGYSCRLLRDTYVVHHHAPGLRSKNHRLIEGTSAVFAGLCYSLRYQRTVPNLLATSKHLLQTALFKPTIGVRCITAGWIAYRRMGHL